MVNVFVVFKGKLASDRPLLKFIRIPWLLDLHSDIILLVLAFLHIINLIHFQRLKI